MNTAPPLFKPGAGHHRLPRGESAPRGKEHSFEERQTK